MPPDIDYRLIGINCHVNSRKLAELSDPIFYPDTQNTLADGRLCAAWDLKPGQEVLTHDFTQQKITCIEIETQGARDKNCPIRIPKTFLAPITIKSSAQNIALYIPKPIVVMGDGSSKPSICAMARQSTGWRPVLSLSLIHI